MLKRYGDWIKPLQYRLHLSTVEFVIRLYHSFQAVIWFSAPTGFLAVQLNGVIVPWCNGATLKINLPAMLFEHLLCHACNDFLLLVRPVTGFGVPTLLNKLSFFSPFQIVISWYERFTSLPFSRHSPLPKEQRVSRPQPDGWIVFNLPAMLASCAPCVYALWTLWGLRILGEYRVWIGYFVTPRRGEVCMVAPPLSGSFFQTQKYVFCSIDTHWLIERVMIFQGWSIPGKLTVVNHHGWTSLLRIFRPWLASFSFVSQSLIG